MAKSKPAKKAGKAPDAKKRFLQKQRITKGLSAKLFVERLKALQSDEELKKIQRYFKSGEGQYGEGDKFIGVKMGQLFALAIEFNGMPVGQIEKLLESPIHEARAGRGKYYGQRIPE
jgi:hypothetical protein